MGMGGVDGYGVGLMVWGGVDGYGVGLMGMGWG